MSEYGKSSPSESKEKERWQKIMDMPEHTAFYDRSTGITYKRGMFKPLFCDHAQHKVDNFGILGTSEQVYVPFLRLLGDFSKCSLMEK